MASSIPIRAKPQNPEATRPHIVNPAAKIIIRNLDFYYSGKRFLERINLSLYDKRVTALIGPSGCGKSTLLRVVNRMFELYPEHHAEGEILIDGENILTPSIDLNLLRARVGMVFQQPAPFPMSIRANVAFGIKLYERLGRRDLDRRVEAALRCAALWDEVKDRLRQSALALSIGQQQRLCIARTLALNPEVLLLDEPTSALDPIATSHIEELIEQIRRDYCITIITHNLQQAARISDYTAFMYLGQIIEFGETVGIFSHPVHPQTEAYITGRVG